MTRFAFLPRPICICGAALPTSGKVVTKPLPYCSIRHAKCHACGSFIQSPMLDAASITAWYESDDYQGGAGKAGIGYINYAQDEKLRGIEAEGRYRRDIAPFLPPSSKVLEIGCGSGSLLAELAKHGHSVIGCDLSERFAAMAAEHHGIKVERTDYLDMSLPPASLDAVLLFGTASNLQRLGGSLRRIHEHLKSNGILLLNFPSVDSLTARIYGRWHWMFTPSVMQFMTRRGARHAVENAGLRVESLSMDLQAPSLAKILGHTRLGASTPWFSGLESRTWECRLSPCLASLFFARASRNSV